MPRMTCEDIGERLNRMGRVLESAPLSFSFSPELRPYVKTKRLPPLRSYGLEARMMVSCDIFDAETTSLLHECCVDVLVFGVCLLRALRGEGGP